MATDSRDSRLLALPAELRNRIYRLVLVEEDEITTAAQGPLPIVPPFLSTNRQVRQEAMSIYLDENKFVFKVRDLDAGLVIKFWNSKLVESRQHIQTYTAVGEPTMSCWENVETWLHAYYQRKGQSRGTSGEDDSKFPRSSAIGKLFDVVDMHKNSKPLPSWEEVVKPQLELIRRALALVDTSGVWT